MKYQKYILFVGVLVCVALRVQIEQFVASFGREEKPFQIIKNEGIKALLLEKAATKIDDLVVSGSDSYYGMMIGVPGSPRLVLSRGLYDNFEQGEIEYVVLHEAGHYKLMHSVIEVLVGLLTLIFGVLLLSKTTSKSGVLAVALGLFFGVAMIQLGRLHEVQADTYALHRINNPEDMISATNKFQMAYEKNRTESEVLEYFFHRRNPYENRIKMAKLEINARHKK